jgi:multiple sugar transport system ATP-binding protein
VQAASCWQGRTYALYPTRTVLENIASPLNAPTTLNPWTAQQKRERIDEVLALTEMARFHERLPSQLSGGQKQRVALCRALVQDPSVFVLDEPIGHLDAKLRHKLRGEIRRRQRQLRQGSLWLTPDGIEAMAVADRMVVLLAGQVQQIGTPAEVFARPANVAVARLLGDPAMNVVPVCLHGGAQPRWCIGDAAPSALSQGLFDRLAALASSGTLMLGLRPADLRLVPLHSPAEGERLSAQVYAVEPLGKHTLVTVTVGGQRLRVKAAADTLLAVGADTGLAIQPGRLLSFDTVTGALHRPDQVLVPASLPQEVSP